MSKMERFFIEKTIPTLTFTSWIPSQSEHSLYSSQSDSFQDTNSESTEIFDINHKANIDEMCSDCVQHETTSLEGSTKAGRNKSDLSEKITVQQDIMSLKTEHRLSEDIKSYHKELPCLNIIIDDYDKEKLRREENDYNHHYSIDTEEHKDAVMKWYELPESAYKQLEKENISPVHSWLNSIEEDTRSQSSLTLSGDESSDISDDRKSNLSADDLEKLKKLAIRLKLQTRRGSYTTWRNKLTESFGSKSASNVVTSGGLRWIKEKLEYLRSELQEIRKQDESLARQFITLHNEMQHARLQHSRWAVQDMVDEAQWTIAENEEFEHICDEPKTLDRSPLLTVGITKMNLTERRFSVF